MRGFLQRKRDEKEKRRGKQKGEIREGRANRGWRREDCSYCRGGPTATYKLHSYKCLNVILYTCKCEHKQASVPNLWIPDVCVDAVCVCVCFGNEAPRLINICESDS